MNTRFDPVLHDLNKHMAQLDEAETYERLEEAVNERAKEIAHIMITPDGFRERGVTWNMSDVTEHIYNDDDEIAKFNGLIASIVAGSEMLTNRLELQTMLLQHAEAVANDIAWREVE